MTVVFIKYVVRPFHYFSIVRRDSSLPGLTDIGLFIEGVTIVAVILRVA